MKRFEAVFNEDENIGVFGISLVKYPAMQGDFLTFSEQKLQFTEVDKEKRILLGLVLEPNKDILRIDRETGERYTITFSDNTIEALAHNFQKQGFQNVSTIEHNGKIIEGISFVETWVVEDLVHEKSVKHGFNYPVGSWLVKMKVDSDEIWNEYVKTGVVKGFSIDAFVELKEINTNIEMSKDTKSISSLFKELAVKLGLSEIEIKDDLKATEEMQSFMDAMDKLLVNFSEAEKTKSDERLKEVDDKLLKLSEDKEVFEKEIKDSLVKLSEMKPAKVELSEDKTIVDLKDELDKVKKEVLEFSKRPAVKPVKSAPSQIEYSKLSNFEKLMYNEQNR